MSRMRFFSLLSSMAKGHLPFLRGHLPMSYGHLPCLPGLFIALLVSGAQSVEGGYAMISDIFEWPDVSEQCISEWLDASEQSIFDCSDVSEQCISEWPDASEQCIFEWPIDPTALIGRTHPAIQK